MIIVRSKVPDHGSDNEHIICPKPRNFPFRQDPRTDAGCCQEIQRPADAEQ